MATITKDKMYDECFDAISKAVKSGKSEDDLDFDCILNIYCDSYINETSTFSNEIEASDRYYEWEEALMDAWTDYFCDD